LKTLKLLESRVTVNPEKRASNIKGIGWIVSAKEPDTVWRPYPRRRYIALSVSKSRVKVIHTNTVHGLTLGLVDGYSKGYNNRKLSPGPSEGKSTIINRLELDTRNSNLHISPSYIRNQKAIIDNTLDYETGAIAEVIPKIPYEHNGHTWVQR
jgi:hypothetical protein